MSYKENPYKYSLQYGYAPLANGGEWKQVHVSTNGHVVTQQELDHIIYHGNGYGVGYYDASVSNGSSIDVLVSCDDVPLAVQLNIAAGGDCLFNLYENPTISSVGTALTAINLNRNSTKTCGASISHTPTVSSVGTLIYQLYSPGGMRFSAGGGDASFQRGILKKGEQYLFRLTNTAGLTKPMQISLLYFNPEEEEI